MIVEARFAHPVLDASALGAAPSPCACSATTSFSGATMCWHPRAAPDRCPHRGTRLSLGRVCDGQIECPYHGWRFDGAGRCAHPRAARLHAAGLTRPGHDTLSEAHGLLWLHLQDDAARPRFDAEADAALRKLNVGLYDGGERAAHRRELPRPRPLRVRARRLARDRAHAQLADLPDRAHRHRLRRQRLPRLAAAEQPPVQRRQLGRLPLRADLALYAAVLTKLPEKQGGYRDEIALFVCPVDGETSRVWFRMALTDHDSSDEQIRAFQHTIFTQDQPVLESQRPGACRWAAAEVH